MTAVTAPLQSTAKIAALPPETLLTSRRWPNDPVVSKASPLSDPVRLAKDPESSPEALTRVIPIGTCRRRMNVSSRVKEQPAAVTSPPGELAR